MNTKDIVRKNLTELVSRASHDGTAVLTSFGILVMHNGSIEAWLHAEDEEYGCWLLGNTGEVVGEINLSRDELIGLDIAVTTDWFEEMIASKAKHERPQSEPIEIYLGGELMAVRTKPYVMVSSAYQEIRPTFSSDECVFGFQRVRLLDGIEDPAGIMESIFQECLSYLETHPDAAICVADGENVSVFSADDLPRLRTGSPK